MKQIHLDKWQKEILNCDSKRILLCKGRQIGGTTIFARKAAERLAKKANEEIMVVSITEDQAQLVIIMVLGFLERFYPKLISKKKQNTTKGKILLKNKSVILSRPVGQTGSSVRGFTKGVLWLNEASRLPEFVFEAAKPMLLTTDGDIWMDSTPFGRRGYFYSCFTNKNNLWTVFYKTSEQVMNEREISEGWTAEQRAGALKLLEEERKEMTNLQYGQEYLGLFLEDLQQFFDDDLIEKCCKGQREGRAGHHYYLGVDVAGLGKDITTYETVGRTKSDKLIHVNHRIEKKNFTTKTVRTILEFERQYNYDGIGVDGSGIGFGVFSLLRINEDVKRKSEDLNKSSVGITYDDSRKRKLLGEDMYINLKVAMEQGNITLLDDDDVKASLKSIQYEFVKKDQGVTKLRIFGVYSHIVEGLIRAVWLATQDKSLNIWVRSRYYGVDLI